MSPRARSLAATALLPPSRQVWAAVSSAPQPLRPPTLAGGGGGPGKSAASDRPDDTHLPLEEGVLREQRRPVAP